MNIFGIKSDSLPSWILLMKDYLCKKYQYYLLQCTKNTKNERYNIVFKNKLLYFVIYKILFLHEQISKWIFWTSNLIVYSNEYY